MTIGASATAADMAVKSVLAREALCDYGRFDGGYVGGNAAAVQYTSHQQDQDLFFSGQTLGPVPGPSPVP